MKTAAYAESQARFDVALDIVVDGREEAVITRAGPDAVVIMSLVDFESVLATLT